MYSAHARTWIHRQTATRFSDESARTGTAIAKLVLTLQPCMSRKWFGNTCTTNTRKRRTQGFVYLPLCSPAIRMQPTTPFARHDRLRPATWLPGSGRFVDLPADVTDDLLEDELQSSVTLATCDRHWYCKPVPVRCWPTSRGRHGRNLRWRFAVCCTQPWRAHQSTKPHSPGAIIRVQQVNPSEWQISQVPAVQAAFVSVDPDSGKILSLIGGFDFNHNSFNHVTQAGGSWVQL